MPLRPFSELLRFLHDGASMELVIAQEPQPSVTPEDVYNAGVFLLRVSGRTRAFLKSWLDGYQRALASAAPPATNQPALRRALLDSRLHFGTFPSNIIAARVFPWLRSWSPPWSPPFPKSFDSLRNTTVAYHAIALNHDPSLPHGGRGQDNKILTMQRAADAVRLRGERPSWPQIGRGRKRRG